MLPLSSEDTNVTVSAKAVLQSSIIKLIRAKRKVFVIINNFSNLVIYFTAKVLILFFTDYVNRVKFMLKRSIMSF